MWARFFTAIDNIILKFKCPSTDEWIKDVVYLYNGLLLSHKKNEIMPLAATWMDIVIAILSEEGQKEKDKCPLHVEPKKLYKWTY